MVAFASQGHINPMLRLGKHLQNKGLHVTLATTEIFRHRFFKHNQSTTTDQIPDIPSISGIDILFFSDGFSLDYDRKANLDKYMETLAKFGSKNVSNLITSLACDKTRPKKISCLINNPFIPWVADVAKELSIPCAMLWIQPCTLLAIYHRFQSNPNDFPTKQNLEKSVKIPGLPLLQPCDLPSFVLPSNSFLGLTKTFFETIQNLHKLKWVLANSFYELEKDVISNYISTFVTIRTVGPLVPPKLLEDKIHDDHDKNNFIGITMWKSDDKCLEWLNKNDPKSVIYVSFGSLIVHSREAMDRIATALRNTKRPFLWVVKPPDNPVQEGAGELPKGFIQETKEQGLVVNWAPQHLVLTHEAIGCFLTHCGWNSVLETISVGVPIIAYPMWTDQPTNAKLLVDVLGIGLRVWPNKDGLVESEMIQECIEEIMGGPKGVEIWAKSNEWKGLARNSVKNGGSSDRNIQEFIDEIIGINS
ncbi:unnamed protein product [Amaranthus hypochondriacus]